MSRGTSVRLQNLTKRFGRVVAVRDLDLEVNPGELVAFLGPSGCGKTTTLLMIAGIYRPTAGHVYFGDRRVDPLHPRDRDVGMVFQSYALYPHLTLFENIAFPLRLKRVPGEEVKRRVKATAELLGIGGILERRPAQVSGGQQQRAALARALVKEPQVLLLDEPLSNLDAQIRLSARAEIRRAIHRLPAFSRQRIDDGDTVDLVAKELQAVGKLLIGGKDIYHIAAHAKGAALKVEIITRILDIHQFH